MSNLKNVIIYLLSVLIAFESGGITFYSRDVYRNK